MGSRTHVLEYSEQVGKHAHKSTCIALKGGMIHMLCACQNVELEQDCDNYMYTSMKNIFQKCRGM